VRALRLYREANGITQTELARRLGIGQGHVAEYELNRRRPKPQRREEVAAAVGTTPEELEVVERVLDGIAPKREKVASRE